MSNLDLKKTHKHLYAPSTKQVSTVDVPELHYLMIDGKGNPNTAPRYQEAVQALYGLAYGVRALSKAGGRPFTVMPLEGLWWFEGEQIANAEMTEADKERFVWTLMILMPDHVTVEMVAEAKVQVSKKKPGLPISDIRFEPYTEGSAVQIMHVGSYADEGPTIARLHEHIINNGWSFAGLHHEIYMSDPRKVPVEKLKTIIRQPYKT